VAGAVSAGGGGATGAGGAVASAGTNAAAGNSAAGASTAAGAGGASSLGGAGGAAGAAGAAGSAGSGGSPVAVDRSPAAWHCVNWAVNGDNFQAGPLLLSGIFNTDTSYDAVKARASAVENAYSDLLKANSFRIPINEPTVNTASYWASYKAIIDVGVSKNMNVLLGFWAKDTGIGRPADINVWYTMWKTVVDAYVSSPNVFFDIHNEPHGYTNSEWIQQVKHWMAKFPNVPKNRIVVAGTGWDDNVANVATAFPDMPLLEVHDYVFNGNYPGSQKWANQLLGRLGSGTSRTLVGEFGTGVAGVDFSTGVESDAGKSFVVGFTNAIHDNKMGSCWWPGLWAVPGNTSSWGLLKMNGSADNITYSINSQTALDRIWHGWGLN
jgi:endoglucanase